MIQAASQVRIQIGINILHSFQIRLFA